MLPSAPQMMFLPPRPYLPLTTVRGVVTYPATPGAFGDAAVRAALARVGLDRLSARLGDIERWDKSLSADEQHALALARLLLHAPQWVFLEDTTASMNEEQLALVRSIFANELAGAAVIGTNVSPALDGFFTRTVHVRRVAPDHPVLVHDRGRFAQRGATLGAVPAPIRAKPPAKVAAV